MQAVAELPRAHPALEPHIQLVIELKQKTGVFVDVCSVLGEGKMHCMCHTLHWSHTSSW
jgi:hypothetical protein